MGLAGGVECARGQYTVGMILSTAFPTLGPVGAWLLILTAAILYMLASAPAPAMRRFSAAALVGGFVLHGLLLVIDIGGIGMEVPGARLGFGPVLSVTVWLVIGVYTVESRLVPLPAVRQWLGWRVCWRWRWRRCSPAKRGPSPPRWRRCTLRWAWVRTACLVRLCCTV
jgi:hypothetical protein